MTWVHHFIGFLAAHARVGRYMANAELLVHLCLPHCDAGGVHHGQDKIQL